MSIIFSGTFPMSGPIDGSKWKFNAWTPPTGGGSFYGRTQQRQALPDSNGGAMLLKLDSYNPSDPKHLSFLGSEAISTRLFDLNSGPIAFEAQVKYAQSQRGIIGGFFTFAGPPDHHDEIDFEAMSNSFSQMQTNIYHNEPLGEGDPISYPLTSPLDQFHTYRIEWRSTEVRWLIDGKTVRTETARVPTKPMALHFNIWAPPADWPTGDASLRPASNLAQNKSYSFEVIAVKVETIS
jgi:Glycosyl hydrolases family 16